MRIIAISDTHGNYLLALKAIEQAGHTDVIIHLGDEIADALIIEDAIGRQIIKLPGNCDSADPASREILSVFDDMKFLLTHGDRYHVKLGMHDLIRKAVTEKIQAVLYGHTHKASIEIIDGIYFINPGYFIKTGTTGSYADIYIKSGIISAEIVPIHNGIIDSRQ